MKYQTEEEFLKNYNPKEYDALALTTDILVLSISNETQANYRKTTKKHMSVLMVKRTDFPFKDKWCLPGGFLKINEPLEECPKRILKKETNLDNIYLEQLYTFGSLNRDPRMRVISTSYVALVDKDLLNNNLNSNASWFNLTYNIAGDIITVDLDNDTEHLMFKLKKELYPNTTDRYHFTILENDMIAFDHPLIIYSGIERIKNKVSYTDIAFNLMPTYFTLGDLQQVYEVILNKKLLDPAFRRIIANKVEKTTKVKKGEGHRPSILYKYKNTKE